MNTPPVIVACPLCSIPAISKSILSSLAGVRTATFTVPRLPPLMSLTRVFANAKSAWMENDPLLLEQAALDLAAITTCLVADTDQPNTGPTARDQQRITRALRHIEARTSTPITVGRLASEAAMSPYHFLRTFRHVVGMTPHQFLLRLRLQDAAVQLRHSAQPVLDIALNAGFADLSTFNRRFRVTIGMTPSQYRRSAGR